MADLTDSELGDSTTENAIAHPVLDNPSENEAGLVLIEAGDWGAVTLTLNRPAKKNAFDAAMIAAIADALETVRGIEGLRVVFLRGAGGTFCAGADLDWMRAAASWSEADNREDALALARMLKALHDLPALTVALVDGAAMGGGAGLVCACDLAIATRDAKLAFSEVRLGLIAATISPYVVAATGPRVAKVLFTTGRLFSADEARGWGIVGEVVADGPALTAASAELAKAMRACAPEAVAASKALVDHVVGKAIDRGLMDETAKRIARTRVGAEGQEGVGAFLEKRRAAWAQ